MPAGLDNILKTLNKEIRKIEGDTFIGVKKAGIFVQGESQEIVPQRLGVLFNSAFTQAERQGSRSVARVGYTAKYAPFVHEMPASFNYTKPGTGPKFLQKAIANNRRKIVKIIADSAKVKK